MKRLFSYITLLALPVAIQAQTLLTVQEAVEIALKNNFDILVAKNDVEVASLYNTPGNAGMLPDISLNAGQGLSNNNLNQKYTNGLEVNRAGVGASNFNANIALNWTLFDGMRMFILKNRYETLEQQSDLNLKEQVQLTVADVMRNYYLLVSQKIQIKTTETALDLVNKRLEITKVKFEVGVVSALEVNQVAIDQATFSADLLLQKNTLKNLKMGFNAILARQTDMDFEVLDTILVDTLTNFEISPGNADVLARQNFSLLSAEKDIRLNELLTSEARSLRMPFVQLNSSYGYTRNTSQAGLTLLNQSNGLNVGFTATMPLFSGFMLRNQQRAAGIQVKSATLLYNKLKLNIDYTYRQAYNNYKTYHDIYGLEANSARLAYTNITIADARFSQGLSSFLEVKEAQRNWQDAENRLITTQYNLKLAEIELKQLRGELVK